MKFTLEWFVGELFHIPATHIASDSVLHIFYSAA